MKEKKSLVTAMEKAQQFSLKDPGSVYYVMDKPHNHAVVIGSAWVRQQRVLEGWNEHCRFLSGKVV